MTDDLKGKPTVFRFDLGVLTARERELLATVELALFHFIEKRVTGRVVEWIWASDATIFGKYDTLEDAIAAIKGTS